MNSRIEQIIEEIEAYIAECKPKMFSDSDIIVNRDELEELLSELKSKTPEEIRRYQKIISNQEAIMADARQKADAIIAQAQVQTNELVSEHQIMQQAYAQANEVVMLATKQAQEILDKATTDANNIRESAIAYTDDLLRGMEETLVHSIDTSRARQEAFVKSLQQYLDVVTANRAELRPQNLLDPEPEPQRTAPTPKSAPVRENTKAAPEQSTVAPSAPQTRKSAEKPKRKEERQLILPEGMEEPSPEVQDKVAAIMNKAFGEQS